MIEAGGKMKIEVSSDDLVLFADRLIEKAMEAKALMKEQTPEDETWLSTDEVAKMCGVCETTLWSWEKKGYLVPSRMGRKKRYALSAIRRYFPHIPTQRHPKANDSSPFVLTTARYSFTTLSFRA